MSGLQGEGQESDAELAPLGGIVLLMQVPPESSVLRESVRTRYVQVSLWALFPCSRMWSKLSFVSETFLKRRRPAHHRHGNTCRIENTLTTDGTSQWYGEERQGNVSHGVTLLLREERVTGARDHSYGTLPAHAHVHTSVAIWPGGIPPHHGTLP